MIKDYISDNETFRHCLECLIYSEFHLFNIICFHIFNTIITYSYLCKEPGLFIQSRTFIQNVLIVTIVDIDDSYS